MQTAYMVLYPGGKIKRADVTLPDRPPGWAHDSADYYTALKTLVESFTGPPMEHVTVFGNFGPPNAATSHRYLDMFVNELGHVSTPPLMRNDNATTIYRRNYLAHHADEPIDPETLPWIAGTAVLFRDKVWR